RGSRCRRCPCRHWWKTRCGTESSGWRMAARSGSASSGKRTRPSLPSATRCRPDRTPAAKAIPSACRPRGRGCRQAPAGTAAWNPGAKATHSSPGYGCRSSSDVPPSLGHDLVARPVFAADLHPPLLHERPQQGIERFHHVLVAVDLERAVLLDAAHAVFLDVAGDDAGEGATQVRCKL